MSNKLKIEKIYCYIVENEEGEGVAAFKSDSGWMPMIGADMKRVNALSGVAEQLADTAGKRIRLCEFTTRTMIREIYPKVKK